MLVGFVTWLLSYINSLNEHLKAPEVLQSVNDEYNYLKVVRIVAKGTSLYIVHYTRKTEVPNTTNAYAIDSSYAPSADLAAFTFYQQVSGYSLVQGVLRTTGTIQLLASTYNEDLAGDFIWMYTK